MMFMLGALVLQGHQPAYLIFYLFYLSVLLWSGHNHFGGESVV